MSTYFFYTPYRQVFDNFVKMHGEQVDPGDSIDYAVPTITTTATENDIYDYMGIPPGAELTFSALPFRCINHIYNNWFRNQNFIASLPMNRGDGPDLPADYTLSRKHKKRDYLVSALPWPQKGSEVTIPLGDKAYVASDQGAGGFVNVLTPLDAHEAKGLTTGAGGASANITLSAGEFPNENERLYADLSSSTGISINDLRESIQIQRLLERDARSGTRFPEVLKAQYGVTDPSMLVHQRPVYLGGGTSQVNISPVAQTTDTLETAAGDTPQGNLAAYGTVSANGHGFVSSFTEHGHIIGFVSIRADITYQQGLERYWSRQTRYDFYYPVLSHLGEQAILNKEIYADGTAADELVFGYTPRYEEYRFAQSRLSGIMRSVSAASLDVWHLAQDFDALPVLGQTFLEEDIPFDRVVAVPAEPDFLLDCYFKIRAARPLPMYATPGLMDHF